MGMKLLYWQVLLLEVQFKVWGAVCFYKTMYIVETGSFGK